MNVVGCYVECLNCFAEPGTCLDSRNVLNLNEMGGT